VKRAVGSRIPLLWKIITPTIVIVAILGPAAGFVFARDRANRADVALSRELASELVSARARLHERALYVREAVSQAANLQGMASAIERGDPEAVARLLDSVRALKADVDVLAVIGRDGFDPSSAGALLSDVPTRIADGRLIVTQPVCRPGPECSVVGTAVGAVPVADAIAGSTTGRASVILAGEQVAPVQRREPLAQGLRQVLLLAALDGLLAAGRARLQGGDLGHSRAITLRHLARPSQARTEG
jgi:hypothetical protein